MPGVFALEAFGEQGSASFDRLESLVPLTSIYQLRTLVSRLSDAVYANHGHDRLRIFDSLLGLLASKAYDEWHNPNRLELTKLLRVPNGQLEADYRRLLAKALEWMRADGSTDWPIPDARTLRSCISILAPHSLRSTVQMSTQAELLGTFYQEIVSSTFRGSLGAYFTPRPIVEMAIGLVKPSPEDDIFDISCGSGTFLLGGYLAARSVAHPNPPPDTPRIFGCDIQERMVATSTINCFLHGSTGAHIIHKDSLTIDLKAWAHTDVAVPEKGFSLIVGNPPFAGFEDGFPLPYPTGRERERSPAPRVNKVIPFIVKTVELLRAGGRAVLVVPTSVLNGESPAFEGLRTWLRTQVNIRAVVSLPKDAFVHTDCGIEGALLYFVKKDGKQDDTDVFSVSLADVGYDRRGRPTSHSDIPRALKEWTAARRIKRHWVPRAEFDLLERWDPQWLSGRSMVKDLGNHERALRLTELCEIRPHHLRAGDIDPDSRYRYFELADADIDSGAVTAVHEVSGREILQKGRLRLKVESGDVLLPNHRDSLIAKTAQGSGRSAVLVPDELGGCIVTNRFIVLKPRIDPSILVEILNSDIVRQQMVMQARGSASYDIRDRILRDVWVPRKLAQDREVHSAIKKLVTERNQLATQLEATRTRLASVIRNVAS